MTVMSPREVFVLRCDVTLYSQCLFTRLSRLFSGSSIKSLICVKEFVTQSGGIYKEVTKCSGMVGLFLSFVHKQLYEPPITNVSWHLNQWCKTVTRPSRLDKGYMYQMF